MNDSGNGRHHSNGGGNGVPQRRTARAVPARKGGPAAGIPASVFWGALRRRWLPAVALGLVCGALAMFAAWQFVPAPFTATADLLIASVDDSDVVLYKLDDKEATFQTYKQTQMRAILNRPTLITALRPQEISGLELVQAQQHPVDWLVEKLEVTSPDTEFIQISLSESTDRPKELADIVNSVMNAYLDLYVNNEDQRQEQRRRTLENLQQNQIELLRELNDEQYQLAQLASASDVQHMTLQEQAEITYGNQLQKRLTEVRFELTSVENELALKQGEAKSGQLPEGVSTKLVGDYLQQDPQFLELQLAVQNQQKYVTELETAVNKAKGQANENNAAARLLSAEQRQLETRQVALERYAETRQPQIVERLQHEQMLAAQASADTLNQKRTLLAAELTELEKELQNVNKSQEANVTLKFKMDKLARDIQVAEKLKQTVESQLKQLELEAKSNNRVRKWSPAEVPYERDYAMKYSVTALAGLGGFGGVLALVVWLELMARRISTIDEISEGLRIPVLGSMPHMPRWVTQSRGKRNRERRAIWHASLKESVDATRTMLLRDADRDETQVFLVASALPGEGKTSLSCHLAMSLACAGRKTLLLDADLRRPSAHEVLGRPLKPGFCEVLRDDVPLEEAVQADVIPGLSFLPAGKLNPQSLQRLAQTGADPIFRQFRLDYDIILIDSSPILPVADTLLMAQQVDGVVMSILRDVSRYSKVAAACERLSMLGVNVLGAVAIGLEWTGYGYRAQEKYYHSAHREALAAAP